MRSSSLAHQPLLNLLDRRPPMHKGLFRVRTVHPLSPQLLLVCRQIHHEGRPVLYGSHLFDCAFSVLTIPKLHRQIGPTNFGHIKSLIIGWSDLRRLSRIFQHSKIAKLYHNLEKLTVSRSFLVDLHRPGTLLNLDLCELSDHCQSARDILGRHPLLNVLAQTSTKDTQPGERSHSSFRVKWRFLRSISAMLPSVGVPKESSL